ncbi:hypothetical protein GO730_20520 [Spirosoma sp. HMF3257]|uniref:Lipocalin-like domain-containing protein n=1 Tax=Spirosoma telluris TaxID=2183553 RepID=A0A327NQ91_9BACT|nr:hypothetical protein [Spirosoma telluris]RAI75944.1 hypothetical protein HMF3257_20440 [Spirosoma telluris]
MKHVVFILSVWIALACSKSDTLTPMDDLVGTWQLTSYCKPVSGSACTAVTIPSNKSVLVTFGTNGTFTESYENTKPGEYSFLGCGSGKYSIEGNNVRITALCMSSLGGKLMPVVSIEATRLVLNPFGTGEYVFVR